MARYCVRERWSQISIVLVYSSEFLIQVCRKLPFVIPNAAVKQSAKVLGPLVFIPKPKELQL